MARGADARLNRADAKRIQKFLDSLEPSRRDRFANAVMRDLTKLSVGYARQNIVTGRGEDPVVAPPLPKKLTYRTGILTRSIGLDLSRAPREYIFGAAAKYALIHERGLGRFPKRPFLLPGAQKAIREDALKLFRLYWDRLPR